MTIELSRRGFLAGILAIGVAPIIVRAGLIMPIKPGLVTSLTQLTPQEIATAFAKEMYYAGARRVVGVSLSQSHVDTVIPNHDYSLDIESFSNKHLKPMAQILAKYNPRIGGELILPSCVAEAAIGAAGGFTVRYMRDYNINTDLMITRFDVANN